MLQDGYHFAPPGKLVAAVTYLEITRLAAYPKPQIPEGLSLRAEPQPDPTAYRALFRAVGAPWLWFSRLALNDQQLTSILHHPRVQLCVLERDGKAAGLLELDFRQPGEAELAYLGLTPDCIGHGAGRFLMDTALHRVGRHHQQEALRRFWVHTCSLDHPGALAFYCKAGFAPYQRAVEVFDDPRLTGLLPADCAPQIPLIRG